MTAAVILFLGPTLPKGEATSVIDATVRGPAAHGDLLAAAREGPAAIGLVDGTFERVPAVWHKEILWAMSRGVAVYGAASMGALRAAELAPFGMIGVGAIFEAFRDGVLEADDEVAVRHAPAEHGYRPASEALVDIRATLGAAGAAGVVGTEVATTLIGIAKELHYPDRIYPRLLSAARDRGIDTAAADALQRWLPTGRVSQKRVDACALLQRMAADSSGVRASSDPSVFVPTAYWDLACRELDARRPPVPEPDPRPAVDELRLDPRLYALVRGAAWRGTAPSGQQGDLDAAIHAELRASRQLAALAERARDKRRLLALHGLSDATPRTLGIDVPTLLEDHARASGISGQVTLERLARSVDLEAPALQRLLVAERAYQRILRGEHPRP